jgi:hypothetical protein
VNDVWYLVDYKSCVFGDLVKFKGFGEPSNEIGKPGDLYVKIGKLSVRFAKQDGEKFLSGYHYGCSDTFILNKILNKS